MSDNIGLLFKVKADSSQATAEIKKFRAEYSSELRATRQAASSELFGLASAFGVTGGEAAKMRLAASALSDVAQGRLAPALRQGLLATTTMSAGLSTTAIVAGGATLAVAALAAGA